VDRESIAQAMGAYVMNSAALTINQLCQSRSLTTISHDLPTAMAIDTENQRLAVSNNWATAHDVLIEQLQTVAVNGQRPLSAVQTFFSPAVFHLAAAFVAEDVSDAKSRSANITEEMDAGLEMLNDDGALAKVYVLDL